MVYLWGNWGNDSEQIDLKPMVFKQFIGVELGLPALEAAIARCIETLD